jgi:signal transduction histidine kinase
MSIGTGEIRERLRNIELFSGCTDQQYDWLSTVGEVRRLRDGEIIISDGAKATHFFVLLEGELVVTKNVLGHEEVITRHVLASHDDPSEQHRPALHQFTGELPLLTDGINVATVRASGEATVLSLSADAFFDLLGMFPNALRVLLPTLAWRVRSLEIRAREQATMAALATLAAGLTHELNNPVAAIGRATDGLEGSITRLRTTALSLGTVATEGERAVLDGVIGDVIREKRAQTDALAAADRIDELLAWPHAARASDPDALASVLAEHGITADWLDRRLGTVRPDALATALDLICAAVECHDLFADIRGAISRILPLVSATCDYANLDRATCRELSVSETLDTTLTVLSAQMTEINVVRSYNPDAPSIMGYPSELNQVWTNLIQNAIDAMNGRGTLTLSVAPMDQYVAVEIADTGSGIPEGSLPRIFQPFYTTKEVGKGTGLGLHICHQIVTQRHKGSITVRSAPGDTRFLIRLPVRDRPAGSEPGACLARPGNELLRLGVVPHMRSGRHVVDGGQRRHHERGVRPGER